jgi:polyhydroxybutyrate depolymerase
MNLGKRILFLVCLAAATSLFSPTLRADRMTWTIDGIEREALVFRPLGAAQKAPVVFAFHGHAGTVHGAAEALDFRKEWPRAIVVYMQGLPMPGEGPRGGRSGWQSESGKLADRDLKFFDAVLATLHEKFSVDDSRIYAMGFSDGAYFTYLLWQERPKIFVAFAPCSGKILPGVHLSVPKPVFILAGAEDESISADVRDATIKTVRELDSAAGRGIACGSGCTSYGSPKGTNVRVLVFPGGHEFPPDASAQIIGFFRIHRLSD